jgi:hypothetical protein
MSPIVSAPQQLCVAHIAYPPWHWKVHWLDTQSAAPCDVAGCGHTVHEGPHAETLSGWQPSAHITSPWPQAAPS